MPHQAQATNPPDLAGTQQVLTWSQRPNGDWARTLTAAGDLNGDGFGDLAVGAPTFGAPAPDGEVYVYFGSTAGVLTSTEQILPGSHQAFGSAVRGAGDFNGDGYDDLAVGAPDGAPSAVHVYPGGALGLSPVPLPAIVASDPLSVGAYDAFGAALVGGVDIDGDGLDDIVVGRTHEDAWAAPGGTLYVYFGGPGAISPVEQRIPAPVEATGTWFAHQVAAAGDLNGDGYGDVAVGTYDGGAAYLFYGGTAGLQAPGQTLLPPPGAESLFAQGRAGFAGVRSAGDVDADGFDDLVVLCTACPRVSPPSTSTVSGDVPPDWSQALVYYGGPTGLDPEPGRAIEPTDPWHVIRTVGSAGDVDGDGYGDVVLGTSSTADSWVRGADLVYGGPRDMTTDRSEHIPDPDAADYNTYAEVTDGGVDLNGDGGDDLIIGDSQFGYGASQYENGAVFLYYGTPATEHPDSGGPASPDTATPTETGQGPGQRRARAGCGCGGCDVSAGRLGGLTATGGWLLVAWAVARARRGAPPSTTPTDTAAGRRSPRTAPAPRRPPGG